MAYVGARVLFALGDEVRKARELGSYRLLERLGQGAMAEVWSARHRLLARPAAIKLIRPTTASSILGPEAASRFEREAQAIASLRSPHTVNPFDFGIADDGTFYYVMELLDGLDAERMVNQFGPMPTARVLFESPNRFGLLAFYTLHVWAGRKTQRHVRELAPQRFV